MPFAVAKLPVSIPYGLATTVRKRAGGLSSFVACAMKHELERERLGSYLRELDGVFGPVPSKVLKEARDALDKC
jgi:hypothetical protein